MNIDGGGATQSEVFGEMFGILGYRGLSITYVNILGMI